MPAGLRPPQVAYAKEIFGELLRTYSQKELADALDVDQSRVSLGKVYGRVGPFLLLRAALLAKRPIDEVNARLELPPGTLPSPLPAAPAGFALEGEERKDDWSRSIEQAIRGAAAIAEPPLKAAETIAAIALFRDWPVGVEIPVDTIRDCFRDLRRVTASIRDDLRRAKRLHEHRAGGSESAASPVIGHGLMVSKPAKRAKRKSAKT